MEKKLKDLCQQLMKCNINGYAESYTITTLKLLESNQHPIFTVASRPDIFKAQIRYILNNITHTRNIKEIRAQLKEMLTMEWSDEQEAA
jgi:hypothetical protein